MPGSTQEALSRIEAGIEAARKSDKFREYLSFCARFHKYSLANQLLIWTQRPTANLVAGFHSWLGVGRHVRKGEKGIMILAPIKVRRQEPATNEQESEADTCLYFKPVYVFDVSQTDGDDLPSPVAALQGDDDGIWNVLTTVAEAEGLRVTRKQRPDESASGFYVRSEGRIWVKPDLAPLHAAKTLAHELSHHFASHDSKSHKRDEAEMVAESAAFVVMTYFGCDSGDYSFGYLASWGDVRLFKTRLQDIHDTANALIVKLEAARFGLAPLARQ